MSTSPVATWDTIQDVFYRKDTVYDMSWSIPDLSDYIVATAKNGGPVAMIRDERKIMLLGRHAAGKPKIYVYTSSGILLSTLTWDLTPPVLLHFTSQNLIVLSDEGLYRVYDLSNPTEYKQYTLGSEVSSVGIIEAQAWEDGLVVLTGDLQFLEVRRWGGGRAVPLCPSELKELPASWTLLSPDKSPSGHVQVLFSINDTIITLDALERIDQHVSRGPFSQIRISPNGRFLALLTVFNTLWVVSSDLSRNLSEVDVSQWGDGQPDRVEWCGDNAVVIAWGGKVAVAGPGGDCLIYDYPPSAHLVGETDGLRVISSHVCDFIQKVPDYSLAVFKPGSTHPAAILLDALDHFERKSPKADESVRYIRAELADAVDTCIEAAGREIDSYWQKRLLRAAQFGRAFIDLYNPSDFVEMAQTLKVLNAVRYYQVGIPITYEQYTSASPTFLISHLVSRNLHLLALRISQHLHLRPDAVLKHWAIAKITHASSQSIDPSERGIADDHNICSAIVSKFQKEGKRSVSYAEIAKKAWEAGRTRLATMLLDHEPRAAEQVPLLLQMKQDKLALGKAVDSGDTDLVYQVLLNLHSSLTPGDFFHLLDDSLSPNLTPAVNLLQVYARQSDRELLRNFYYQDDRRTENGCLDMEEAGESASVEKRKERLGEAARHFGESKERAFESKMAEDAQRLLTLQDSYQNELSTPTHQYYFASLSVDAFIHALLVGGFSKRAEKVRSDFRVPDKRFWWVKLKALAEVKDWDALEVFAKAKKSPIGYEPFVRHLLKVGEPQKAVSYVARCDAKARVDLYVECGEWGRAAELAREKGDKGRLEQLKRQAPTGLAQRDVEEVMRRPGK
ncbi:hypothetical protein L202_00723 [Cryptococcus amylolentus CBS 6039]|uniref:Probable vacuolar protein sorting-associated protein 16 homolog n=1 Tax=Cryptococcus amylolentus CBS 6039 TaxID=1295533 RepID=A0A1E3I8P3_9TREE|nr:hypothetical protein L202_00723 [Cryptococcus amylolentus CBS 6039]ODN84868.1 hypothetical protein L202_00723 [Cryptococcus amylolentus CBS 6039]